MTNRDFAKKLIDLLPEEKLPFLIAYLQGASIPEALPELLPKETSTEALPPCVEFPAPADRPDTDHAPDPLFERLLEK